MIARAIGRMMARDLQAVGREIEAYADESDLWRLVPGVRNPAGNLALHVAGNLAHFVGATLGGTGYVRDREAEFSRRDVPRAEIVAALADTRAVVEATLSDLVDDELKTAYPLDLGGTQLTTGEFLLHLSVHLGYHLGQIDYHRRFLTAETGEIEAVAVYELRPARPTG